ncbi:MAG: hypothetical protein U5R30_04860 [Deltaproteobacteria bacterium]|nr:hypothetical protein [Deltaproteobacteria bacterium]
MKFIDLYGARLFVGRSASGGNRRDRCGAELRWGSKKPERYLINHHIAGGKTSQARPALPDGFREKAVRGAF